MNKTKIIAFFLLLIIFFSMIFCLFNKNINKKNSKPVPFPQIKEKQSLENPLSINAMRRKNYDGSNLTIEQTLKPGSNYNQYIASYLSDGLKIYGLLTVPTETRPDGGYPAIIFNHGYLAPETYTTTGRYVAYVDGFAKNGYIVFKPDFRGHGNSEGTPEGAYYSPAYAVDTLNALASIREYKDVDPEKIGMWGHSMGGNITLRNIVVDINNIKAAVIWGGVVGSYDDLMNNWARRVSYQPPQRDLTLRNNHRQNFIDTFGTPSDNPQFWQSIDPTYHLSDITAPVQLHTGENDEEVPWAFSSVLYNKLLELGKTVEYYNYPEGDHNISSPDFQLAMRRSIDFFNKYLK